MARSLNLSQLTLRDKIREAARRAHDMNEHIEHAFVPKVHQLRKLTRPTEPEVTPVPDLTIRHHAAIVLDSEKYTVGLDDESTELFAAIVDEVDQILNKQSFR
ncbi:MAG: hypothetical protein JSS49_11760 [Planctomycetes bacterium]|nr:hypothetical protein [Planctomycetota bacterium]